MALGQYQPPPTGSRPGGGIRRGTTVRTTPLAPQPTTPLNTGNIRRPAGMNAQMGEVRSDRGGGMQPGSMQQSPGTPRTRTLRPLIADRVQRQPYPQSAAPQPQYPQPQPQPQQQLQPRPMPQPAYLQPGQFGQMPGSPTGPTPGQQLMRQTMRAYQPQQPQMRGPYAPTPGTSQNFMPNGFAPRETGG